MYRFPEEPAASVFVIIPTQIFIVLFLFLGLIFRITELTLFSLILLIIGIGAYFWSHFSIKGLTCSIDTDKTRMFPGETLRISLHTVNRKFLPVLVKIKLSLDRALIGTEDEGLISEKCGLLWYQTVDFEREYTPQRRGVYKLGPPFLRIADIFGFFPNEKDGTGDHEIVVYPRIVDIKSLPLPKREFYGIPGAHSPVEDPVFIFGTRDYQPGSPARRIHWKASARHNRLQEKLCEPAEQEKVLLALDVSRFEEEDAEEALERTLEIAASLTLQFDRKGYSVGIVTNGRIRGWGSKIIPMSRSPHQISVILELLARLQMEKEGDLHDILSRGYNLPWGVSCLHLSYDRDGAASPTEAYFRERNIPMRFIIYNKPADPEGGMYLTGTETFFSDDIVKTKDKDR